MKKINAAFNSASEEAISIHSIIKKVHAQDTLIIAKQTPYKIEVDDDTILITDSPLVQKRIMLFTNDDFLEAVEAYRNLTVSGRCLMHEDIARFKIDNVLEVVGRKDNGSEQYNINVINNGHLAVLATCLFLKKQINAASMFDAMDFLNQAQSGRDEDNDNSIEGFIISI